MIDYISGEITELTPTAVVIECNGIGYYINITLNTYSSLANTHRTKIFVYEAIREDAIVLYGFLSRRERVLFLLLISVSGVGSNTARVILSSLTPAEVEQAIVSENITLLKGVKGIGIKTAQRIIVDLKDKVISGNSETAAAVKGAIGTTAVQDEALAALTMLGFAQSTSMKVIQKLLKEHPQSKVEEIIKAALKLL